MRHFHQLSAVAASEYYHAEPGEMGEYYGEQVGVYFGKGAAALGLTPDTPVDQATFEMLVNNVNPATNDRLTSRNAAKRRVLTDLTFDVPKSWSIAAKVLGDIRLDDAMLEVGLETMAEAENDAQVRVNPKRGEMHLEKTRNWVGIAFPHGLSRPVAGEPDPQGHVHFCIINATQCEDGEFKAIDLSAVVKDKKYYNSLYMSKLAQKAQELGYEVKRTANNFEIVGLSDRSLIEKFSRRTMLIEELAKKKGITNPDAKDALGAKTRDRKKDNNQLPDNLQELWRSRLSPEEAKRLEDFAPKPYPTTPKEHGAKACVDWAIEHKFSNQTVIRRRELVSEALLHGIENATAEQIEREINSRPWESRYEEDKQLISPPERLAEERQVMAYARQGKGTLKPIAPDHVITRDFLSAEQRNAVMGVLSSTNRIEIISGRAGVGKTSSMREITEAIASQRLPAAVLAPSVDASHGVLREKEGFDAETVAHFLLSEKAQKQVRGGVILVDEAGLLNMGDLSRLIDVAESVNARIILMGDRKQFSSVSYGEPLRLLETQAGVEPWQINTIRRQQEADYREIAQLMSEGGASVNKAIDKLSEADKLVEIADDQERNQTVAKEYADAVERGESTLVVTPSNIDREATNTATRHELKERGTVADQDHWITTLKSRHLTDAQKKDPLSYTPGVDVVEFHRNAGGMWKSRVRATVAAVEGDRVLADVGGVQVQIPISEAGSFDVFREQLKPFSAGETIRFTKNRYPTDGENTKRIHNGSVTTIEGFTKEGLMRLSNHQVINPEFAHFDHGYAMTAYSSQGKTFNNVITNFGESSLAASSRASAYVSSTRGVKSIKWFTTDVDDLKSAVNRDRTDLLATELAALPETTADMRKRTRGIRERAITFAREQLQRLRRWRQQQHQLELEPAR
ncbi:MAG: MobF family relaxase [Planctomycetota bacterium]